MAQLMPLPLTVSCFSKIQIGFTFLVTAHLGSPGKGAVKRVCVCVCVCVCAAPYTKSLAAHADVRPTVHIVGILRWLTGELLHYWLVSQHRFSIRK